MSRLLDHFSQLHAEWLEQRPCYSSLCSGRFLQVLGTLSRQLAEARSPAGSFEQQIHDYIRGHCTEPLTIVRLARLTGKSPSYLITSYRKRYGESPLADMHRLRINRACELLASTSLSVEAIALQLGYCDASYFYRMFKQRTGLSPSQFRKGE